MFFSLQSWYKLHPMLEILWRCFFFFFHPPDWKQAVGIWGWFAHQWIVYCRKQSKFLFPLSIQRQSSVGRSEGSHTPSKVSVVGVCFDVACLSWGLNPNIKNDLKSCNRFENVQEKKWPTQPSHPNIPSTILEFYQVKSSILRTESPSYNITAMGLGKEVEPEIKNVTKLQIQEFLHSYCQTNSS